MQKNNIDKKVGLLDWGIVFSFLIMLLVIYIPLSIWEEEENYKDESRRRMEIIVNAQEFYRELTGSYTNNGEELLELVESAIDSTIADTLFFGKQTISLKKKNIDVEISKGFLSRADTTFSIGVNRKKTIIDTIYTVEMLNAETNGLDTLFINTSNIENAKNDTLFKKIVSFSRSSYNESYTDYISRKYKLTNDLLLCPLTQKPYSFIINNDDPEDIFFTIKSPVAKDYKERRYLFFKFKSGEHGFIEDKRKSWTSK